MTDYLVAIDLGTTKIVSIVGEEIKDSRQIKIIAYGEEPSEGIRRGQVENIQSVVRIIKVTLESVKAKAGIPTVKEVYVGIAGMNIRYVENSTMKSRPQYEELITEQEIKQLREDACRVHLNAEEKIIHAIPQTYCIDSVDGITDPVGRLGRTLVGNFMVVIEQGISMKHTEICMDRLKLSLKEFILEPMASARAVLSEDEKDMGVAMVDIGGGTTDLIVYKDQIVKHTAIIPFGGNIITKDIKDCCGVTLREAENLKIRYGSCLSSEVPKDKTGIIPGINGRKSREISLKELSVIIEDRMVEIMSMILFEINKYRDKLAAGIVFTGGGSQMKHLCKFAQYKTGMDVRIGQPDCVYETNSGELAQPKYSTAVGLVMCGFDIRNESGIKKTPYLETVSENGRDGSESNNPEKSSGNSAGDDTGNNSGNTNIKDSIKSVLKIFYTDEDEKEEA
jgi:cell division protein FtsA